MTVHRDEKPLGAPRESAGESEPPLARLADLTWTEVRGIRPERAVAILPVGAVEAHGPHLPLTTDVIIAEAMAREGASKLRRRGLEPVLLPALAYTPARFAVGFPGTVSLRPEALVAQIVDIARGLEGWGWRTLVVANAHFDPANLGALYQALDACAEAGLPRPVFPDVTRKPWALRLSDEFKSGACHAGRYEGSVVLAERPDLVHRRTMASLEPNPVSLSNAIRLGQQSFEEAGGPAAYFGYPSDATADEGRRTVMVLGEILDEAVAQALAIAG
ncbi:MAG: creatininase family protein [Acidobacteria bacterium]|nr:creatininase family protein [Acidobacteriota bacterium]